MRILIIEDDTNMAASLANILKSRYVVESTGSGKKGTYLGQYGNYNLIIIDIGLPDIEGTEVCRLIRITNKVTPVLMLTGNFRLASKVASFNLGADDYLTKPFHVAELLARVKALTRRSYVPIIGSPLKAGRYALNPEQKTLSYENSNTILSLSKKESDILECLMKNHGRALRRDMIIECVWADSMDINSNTLDVHINMLRKRLKDAFETEPIKTRYGFGYFFDV